MERSMRSPLVSFSFSLGRVSPSVFLSLAWSINFQHPMVRWGSFVWDNEPIPSIILDNHRRTRNPFYELSPRFCWAARATAAVREKKERTIKSFFFADIIDETKKEKHKLSKLICQPRWTVKSHECSIKYTERDVDYFLPSIKINMIYCITLKKKLLTIIWSYFMCSPGHDYHRRISNVSADEVFKRLLENQRSKQSIKIKATAIIDVNTADGKISGFSAIDEETSCTTFPITKLRSNTQEACL